MKYCTAGISLFSRAKFNPDRWGHGYWNPRTSKYSQNRRISAALHQAEATTIQIKLKYGTAGGSHTHATPNLALTGEGVGWVKSPRNEKWSNFRRFFVSQDEPVPRGSSSPLFSFPCRPSLLLPSFPFQFLPYLLLPPCPSPLIFLSYSPLLSFTSSPFSTFLPFFLLSLLFLLCRSLPKYKILDI